MIYNKYDEFYELEHIEIGLLYGCNLQCPLCELNYYKVNNIKIKQDTLNFENLCIFLSKFPKLKTIMLCGTVSEPTLYYKFLELLTFIQNIDSSPIIKIHTNGNTPNKLWTEISKIIKPKDIIIFGIDGSTQEIYSKYRKGGNLEKVLLNHSIVKEKCITILQYIEFNFNTDTINDIDNIKELTKNEGFTYLDIKKADDPYDMFGDDIEQLDILVKPTLKQQRFYSNKREVNNLLEKEINQSKKDLCYSCDATLHKAMYINFKGHCYPCYGWWDTINNLNASVNNIEEHHLIPKIYYDFLNKRGLNSSPCQVLCNTKTKKAFKNNILTSRTDFKITKLVETL